ncbi:MAG TPA: pentapeptide repeat-containing protein [Phycisphaerae bacterium]|nr:pentapeptide repeat-containing protein [Phycisphaerae bacterium]
MSPEGLCIYHAPQNGRDDPSARRVWNEAKSRAQAADPANFKHWHFPPDPDGFYFRGIHFNNCADFTDAIFECIPYFNGAVFGGLAEFTGTKFASAAHFKEVEFRQGARFVMAYFHQSAFFEGAEFKGKADFERATFNTAASFGPEKTERPAVFHQEARFKWVSVRRNAEFCNVRFEGPAIFQNSEFEGNVVFRGARFDGNATFNFASYRTGRVVLFDEPRSDGKPFRVPAQGETAYRLAKQAAYARRDLDIADRYRLWEWQARAASKHGERSARYRIGAGSRRALVWMSEGPSRVLGIGLVVVLAFWGLYCSCDAVCPAGVPEEEALAYKTKTHEALYFSVVTFTTLGYGDLRPKPIWYWRYVAAFEAAGGAVVIASFVVVLARRLLA